MSKYSKGGRASPWTGLFMSHESHSTLQQGPNVATRSRSGPKSLSSWVEDNCVLMGRILYWNGEICTSQLDSLSPWRSLLRINKGNFLFSLIYFKCQSSHCFSSCAQVLFPVMRGAQKWRTVPGTQLCCVFAVWPWPWHLIYLSFFCSSIKWVYQWLLWRTVKKTKCNYLYMWKFSVKILWRKHPILNYLNFSFLKR